MRLSPNQRDILILLHTGGVLRNGDEATRRWWFDGGEIPNTKSCDALPLRGLIKISGHSGGMPGVDTFSITQAGREALINWMAS